MGLEDDKAVDAYSTDGRFLPEEYLVTFTPEVHLWLNSRSGKKIHRKTFFKKIVHLLEDLKRIGRPVRAHAKVIRKVEVPVFYIRLENDQGLRILFDYSTDDGQIDVRILAVSNKKEFQDKLRRSAEHIVHASTFDRLEWDDEEVKTLDLENCTDKELEKLKDEARFIFSKLPENEQQEGWSEETYSARTRRATIYDFRIPNIVDHSILQEESDFELPGILKLQHHQKKLLETIRPQFLLEGVAGTGKTTILFYRFVEDLKESIQEQTDSEDDILFVTHNERLKKEIVTSLKLFFPPNEFNHVKSCVKTVRELLSELADNSNQFKRENELTRTRFHSMFNRNEVDLDLFWEEYRGILRGYNLNSDSKIISKKEYEDIGRKRGRISPEKRSEFYEIAKEATGKGRRYRESSFTIENTWDELDLCKNVKSNLHANPNLCSIKCLYIDEVQDLTRAELEVLLELLDPKGPQRFAVAGDLSQSIQPSSFTWQALSDLIYEILGLKIGKHDTLTENFRATPFLVEAANKILTLQSELDVEGTPKLQRPISEENTGEPGLIFFNDENTITQELNRLNLPNAGCPMLVRDEDTKEYLKSRITNHANIITISQFKGLERNSILLWHPSSGSDAILDKREDPKRGEFAKKKEYSNSTALLELRHVFVAFTRARSLMGILEPLNKEAHFMRKISAGSNCLMDSAIQKLDLFSEDLTDEALQEYAIEFLNAGLFDQAAEAFRNLGDEHNYHFCKGQLELEQQNYDSAIHHLYTAAVVETGEHDIQSGDFISEYAKIALNKSTGEERSSTLAKILFAANDLSDETRYRLEAERNEERGDWFKAAQNYIKAEDYDRAKFCIKHIPEKERQTTLYLECGFKNEARSAFKSYIDSKIPKKQAVNLALAKRATLNQMFKGPLKSLKSEFKNPDIQWAKRLASGNRNLMAMVSKEVNNAILSRVNTNRTQELEVLRLLVSTRNVEEIKRRNEEGFWNHAEILSKVEYHILNRNFINALRETFDLESEKEIKDKIKSILLATGCTKRDETEYLLSIMKNGGIEAPERFLRFGNYLKSIYIFGIIAQTISQDSKEYPNIIRKLSKIQSKDKSVMNFAIHWSCVLVNYLIRHDKESLKIEDYFLAKTRRLLGLDNGIRDPDDIVDFVLPLLYQKVLIQNADIQDTLQEFWKSKSGEERSHINLFLYMADESAIENLPNFMSISDRDIQRMRFELDNMPRELLRNFRKYFKQQRKEIRNTLRDLQNHPLDVEKNWIRKLQYREVKLLFRSNREIRFILGRVSGLNPSKPKASFPATGSIDPMEQDVENMNAQEIESNQEIQIDEEPSKSDNLDEEEQVTFDASAFELIVDNEHQSLYPDGFWDDFNFDNSKEHVDMIVELIKSKFTEDLDMQRSIIRDYLDDNLPPRENGIEVHLKFEVILAVQRLAIEQEKQYGFLLTIPNSSIELIRLFKDNKENRRLINRENCFHYQQMYMS